MRVLVLLFCLVLTFAVPAFADTRVALVIGNAAYERAPLSNPTVDVDLIRPALEKMGFAVEVVKDADLARFDEAITAFTARARGADLALFYFAGHGFAVADGLQVRNYLMSTSADVTSISDRVIRAGGVALDEVIEGLASSAKTTLVFVDACRNDPRVRATGGTGRGLARIPDAGTENVFVGLSTRLGDVAQDGEAGAGSPFARAFAASMPAPGLRLDDAFTEVRKAVIAATGGDQRPEAARDDLDAPIVLVRADAGKQSTTPETGPSIASPPVPTPPVAPREEPPRKKVDPCSNARADFDLARDIGTVDALRSFAKAYPSCPPFNGYAAAQIAKLTAPDVDRAAPIAPRPPPEPKPEAKPAPREVPQWRVKSTVSEGVLNMRTGPGTNHALVVAIPAGSGGVTVGRCVPPTDGKSRFRWCAVRWRGKSGWVSSNGIARDSS